jgi:hypothetical protein
VTPAYRLVDIEGHKCRYTAGGSLLLTHAASRYAGHWAPNDGAHGALIREEYRRVATAQAMASGRNVEVYATHPRAQAWVVYVAEAEREDDYA